MEGGELAGRAALWMLLFSLAAVFAGAETAITTLWPWKVKQLASDEAEEEERTGRPGSRIFEKLQGDITRVLTTVLVGVTICTIYGTALATDVAVQVWGQAGVGYATTLLTLMTLFFGELVPKSLAVANAEAVARATLPLIHWFSFLLYPLGRVMSGGTRLMLSLLGVTASEDGEAVSEPELRMMLLNAKQSGAVELYEKDMIEGVLDLDQATVEQIMQPRVEVVGIEVGDSLRGLLAISQTYKYSRVPVYNGTIDQVVGVALTRELIDYVDRPGADLSTLPASSLMEDIVYVPETMSAMNALKLMRQRRLHMVVVVDEYGGTAGIVTLEDILETLVGKIYDEDDDDEVLEDIDMIVRREDGSYLIDGPAELEAVCKVLGVSLSEEALSEFATLSGFLCHQAGEIPTDGDVLWVDHVRFTIVEADERRILEVEARNVTAPDAGDAAAGAGRA
ncbi:hypothetical protein EMIHUDRAFT_464911 [Emiliania huxleyi CCMP1516]|uniref:HlyC/CorC family transporter n=2 Tax=Emiliania huxleyi TaxID=2903 RepID=A0A0D3ILK6_EMIH1|nr:hypothetical protein EMIHUDRAFT_464911 [Emiliania huxleyi CCMP1516]EOD12141.1 hypothetical protein EMIHUDRAFT_464911 [Emiliania huxleyi CCMP1516]|eukprot:XP_005764570.1 hypothetical protein EMIHUDRAFT_464911 [Emiliania huxleyi CCMP1516]